MTKKHCFKQFLCHQNYKQVASKPQVDLNFIQIQAIWVEGQRGRSEKTGDTWSLHLSIIHIFFRIF